MMEQHQDNIRQAIDKNNRLGEFTAAHLARISQDLVTKDAFIPTLNEQDWKYIEDIMQIPANQRPGKKGYMGSLPGVVFGLGPTNPKFPNRFQVNQLVTSTSPRMDPFLNKPYRPRIPRIRGNTHSMYNHFDRSNMFNPRIPRLNIWNFVGSKPKSL